MIRKIPDIPKIRARWAHRCSEIPDWLEVPLSDGRVVNYYPQIEQPAFQAAMENVRNMVVGYQRKEPADAANIQPAANEMVHISIAQKRRCDK